MPSEDESSKGFKIQDRRRFSAEGELKPEFSGAEEPAAAKPEAPHPGGPPFQGASAHAFAQGFKSVGVFFDVIAVVESFADDDVRQAERQRQVASRIDGEVAVRERGRAGADPDGGDFAGIRTGGIPDERQRRG